MSRAWVFLLLISGLSAQTANNAFEKAPPATDATLRERITKFYQAQIDKKYRQAEQFVSEDSMDTFLGINKASCVAFKIDKIIYSENFTKARSTVLCNQFLPFPGFEKPVDIPMPDDWKIEDGKWFWVMDLSKGRETPFGHADLTKRPASSGGAPPPPMVTLDSISKGVQADKTSVTLNSKYSSDAVVNVANILPGPVTLHLEGVVPKGVRVNLEQKELNGGDRTRILFHSEPGEDRKPLEVRVLVSPVNIVIPIQVSFE